MVSADADCEGAAQVWQALAGDCDAVIFITRAQQAEQTLAQLDHWRARRPCAARLLPEWACRP